MDKSNIVPESDRLPDKESIVVGVRKRRWKRRRNGINKSTLCV
jgi:hypothetical protein